VSFVFFLKSLYAHLPMIVGHHRPESPKGFRGHCDAKLGDVSFKKHANKIFTPLTNARFRIGEEGSGQAAPYPQPIAMLHSDFPDLKTWQINESDP
jgi:hypothetical protein